MSDFSDVRNAIRKEDVDHLKRIFKNEYINLSDDTGWTPLHWACGYNKNRAIVQYLLDQGSNIEAVTTNNLWRPIHLAVFNGSIPILEELISRKCKIDVKTSRGETPLDVAVQWKKDQCMKVLRKASTIYEPDKCEMHEASPVEDYTIPSLTNYRKGPMLGRGGFGVVYKCFDLDNGQDFAMKEVMLSSGNNINKELKCLENEIKIYTKLVNHPRIVQYFGTVKDVNSMYIFMEYMAGGSIKEQIDLYGPLTPRIIGRYMKHILEALGFLHKKFIIHRDIKASNILRDTRGNIKLSDFGTSRYFETLSLNSVTNTNTSSKGKRGSQVKIETSTLCGTFYWMAPEVIRAEVYTNSADIWSLGATVIEMLTGDHPYPDLEPIAAMFKIGHTSKIDFKPPQSISKELQMFIKDMLTPNPKKRPNVETLLKSEFILKCPC